MISSICLIVLLFHSGSAILTDAQITEEWLKFKSVHRKNFRSIGEEAYRKEVFRNNLEVIHNHNEKFELGLESYEMGVNAFSDKGDEELSVYLGLNNTLDDTPENLIIENSTKIGRVILPIAIDWRTKGGVTPVKNQKNCGSCWAFAAVGALESHLKIHRKLSVSLSEQQLVDCSPAGSCFGGLSYRAYDYIKQQGITHSNVYPYEARNNRCRLNAGMPKVKARGYMGVTILSEKALKTAVAKKGPVVVSIHADSKLFSRYSRGVFYNPFCATITNHAVVVVGYGRENGRDYWLVKNSWGDSWGDNGFIKMARSSKNHCGILSRPLYPLL